MHRTEEGTRQGGGVRVVGFGENGGENGVVWSEGAKKKQTDKGTGTMGIGGKWMDIWSGDDKHSRDTRSRARDRKGTKMEPQ